MATFEQFQQDPKAALWKQLDKEVAVLLGIDGITRFMMPMAAKPDLDADVIWFFTDRRNETFGKLTEGSKAHICLSNNSDHFWADIQGTIEVSDNKEAIANKWSADIEAWYEKGQDDDNLMLMAFKPVEAEVSVSTSNPIKFSWQTVKAILGEQDKPEISESTRVSFI